MAPGSNLTDDLKSIDIRKTDIQYDKIGPLAGDQCAGIEAAASGVDLITVIGQSSADHIANNPLILYHQNAAFLFQTGFLLMRE